MNLRQLSRALFLPLALGSVVASAHAADSTIAPGAVYTMTNAADGNEVAIFTRAVDGVIAFDSFVPTGGMGTGSGLGNQAGVLLSQDERFLFVVNAGSDELSVFAVLENGLALIQTAPTHGVQPISVAQHGELVYVVHAASNSIAGFRQAFDGTLTFLPRTQARLSGDASGPAQIAFDPDGRNLYVSLKARNVIDRFELDERGFPDKRFVIPSNGQTPFGFDFGVRGQLFVSEAWAGGANLGTVSSYGLVAGGGLQTIDASVPNLETAPCWVVASPGGRLIYVSNTATDSISSYLVGFDGGLTLLDATAANTGAGPLDVELTPDGRFFYVLNAAAGSIGDYSVEPDGALASLPGSNSGLPASASGLAAR